MSADFRDLGLHSPWLNASGFLGFAPGGNWSWPEPAGGFVTNPISLHPRTPADGRNFVPYSGGFLLHTGLPNPGFQAVLRQQADRWARSRQPVWVHLLTKQADELFRMVRILEELDGIAAIELGLPPFATPENTFPLIDAAVGELPLILNFPLTLLSDAWLEELPARGVAAISLGAPRGTLVDRSGRMVSGRLYGPALLPFAARAVAIASRSGLPVVGGCGINRPTDGELLLAAGASAVQIDTPLWK
ncbi:MAG TPA: hypothetical protein VFF68_14655 [Anaerolineaceae bacterium]|nr:hypothetical protein [Anaerolineaceae bacterium]